MFSRPLKILTHFKCRSLEYPNVEGVKRQNVPDDKVSWNVEWQQYRPPCFTSDRVLGKNWADPDINDPNFKPVWNGLDGGVNRQSFEGIYDIVDNYPLNPIGRTGLCGRGLLGRWGPNHAADPIITRWKRSGEDIVLDTRTSKPVLQFVAIKRRDCNEWAIPGGMVDPNELVTATLQREFFEEALNSLESSPSELNTIRSQMGDFFKKGDAIYCGYVDDIRNTDNAWIETSAYNFHDHNGALLSKLNLHAGDDAIGVRWLDISGSLILYASHLLFIRMVAEKHGAHW